MPHPADSSLKCVDLACVRGDQPLFDGLSLQIDAGSILQVHGANGAGKTSLLRILCALARPEHGEVLWNDESIEAQPERHRGRLSYLGHLNGIKAELTPLENLRVDGALHAFRDDLDPREALDRAGLSGYEDLPCRYLSAGQKRRVAMARLLLSTTQLWVLDEPATALDRDGVDDFQALVTAHARDGGMVVLTSHQALRFGDTPTTSVAL